MFNFKDSPITANVIYCYINHFSYSIANYIVRDNCKIVRCLKQSSILNISEIADSLNKQVLKTDKFTIVLQSSNFKINNEISSLLLDGYSRHVSNIKDINIDKVSNDFLYWLSCYDSNKILCSLSIKRQIEKIRSDYDISKIDSRIIALTYGYQRLDYDYSPTIHFSTVKSNNRYDGYGRRRY